MVVLEDSLILEIKIQLEDTVAYYELTKVVNVKHLAEGAKELLEKLKGR